MADREVKIPQAERTKTPHVSQHYCKSYDKVFVELKKFMTVRLVNTKTLKKCVTNYLIYQIVVT